MENTRRQSGERIASEWCSSNRLRPRGCENKARSWLEDVVRIRHRVPTVALDKQLESECHPHIPVKGEDNEKKTGM
jgi:hypothetical protein